MKLIFFCHTDGWYYFWIQVLCYLVWVRSTICISNYKIFSLSCKPIQRLNTVNVSSWKVFYVFHSSALFIKDTDLISETLILWHLVLWFYAQDVDEEKLQGALAYWWKVFTDHRNSAIIQRLAILLIVEICKDLIYTSLFGVIPRAEKLYSKCPDSEFIFSLNILDVSYFT